MHLLIQSIAHALDITNPTPEQIQAVKTVLENDRDKEYLKDFTQSVVGNKKKIIAWAKNEIKEYEKLIKDLESK